MPDVGAEHGSRLSRNAALRGVVLDYLGDLLRPAFNEWRRAGGRGAARQRRGGSGGSKGILVAGGAAVRADRGGSGRVDESASRLAGAEGAGQADARQRVARYEVNGVVEQNRRSP